MGAQSVVVLLAEQRKILGSTPPGTALAWIGSLVGLCLTIGGLAALIAASIQKITGREKLLADLAAFVLPVGWLLWGAALLYAEASEIRIIIVAAGVVVMIVVAVILWFTLRED